MNTRNFNPDQPFTAAESSRQENINITNLTFGAGTVFDPFWQTKYAEIKPSLRTGDIILVHGRYPFSWVVAMLQGSGWGHCAMVVLSKDLDPDNKFKLPEVMLWESNVGGEEVPNEWPQQGPVKEGPMLIDLQKRLCRTKSEYKDVKIVHRPLFNCPPINAVALQEYFTQQIEKRFPSNWEIIKSVYIGRKYNRSTSFISESSDYDYRKVMSQAIEAGIEISAMENISFNADLDPNKVYCSELIAGTYKVMGLLTKTSVNNAYAPKDFSSEGKMRLLNRAWLGEEIYIDMVQ